ncbi:MAG: putative glycosyltransferase [Verrucomicrobiales bacterium]|nr:putative glycosyltransferase [Verrucomicrobiales bacterium]
MRTNGILLVSNFLSRWGSRAVCEELALRLSAEGMKVITTSSKRARLPRLVDMMRTTWTRRADYDFAHVAVFSGAAFLWAESTCGLLRRLGKPYALTLHGGNLPNFARANPFRVRRLLKSAQCVLAPSAYLRETMSVYRDDVRLMENAVDIGRYEFRLRKKVQPSLVWLRSFHEIYNPTLAPKVLELIGREFPEARLTMIGPDKDGSLEKTKQTARALRVDDRIVFAGGIEKSAVPEYLHCGDIFLNTSNIDNAPVSVIEAMACGLCVVSTDVGGIPFLLKNRHNALLVPPNDLNAMAGAVRNILIDHDLAKRLSENARTKAEDYDWAVVLPKWKSILGQRAGEISPAVCGA